MLFNCRFWLGATKKQGDEHIRWMSNNASIDPFKEYWESDPRKDVGQFYAQSQNVSCLLIGTSKWFNHGAKWGHQGDAKHPKARGLCEKPFA